MRKQITTSNYDFESLILNNAFYADKTDFLHKLVHNPTQNAYFLSRPRRFGKSLTVSTLKCIFQGKKSLFQGLKIDNLPYDWKIYPVIYLNMARLDCSSPQSMLLDIFAMLKKQAGNLMLNIDCDGTHGNAFGDLITKAAEKSDTGKVVLLIDEYDKPLVENIGKPHLAENREILENFYIQIKNCNDILRFVFMTGVTKFSRISVFSKLNHMQDITMSQDFATMFGYTDDEVDFYFSDRLAELAQEQKVDVNEFREKIKLWYNGFRFEENAVTVYNPVSLGSFLNEYGKFTNHWFATATPTFLMKIMKEKKVDITDLLHKEISEIQLDAFDVEKIDPKALLLQTGYLTIESAHRAGVNNIYQLNFPNIEVENAFNTHLASAYGVDNLSRTSADIWELSQLLTAGETEEAIALIKSYLSAIPYTNTDVSNEWAYNSILYIFFRLAGLNCYAENPTNRGRIDTVIETKNRVYVVEYKYNKSAEEAMAQILQKKYYEAYKKLALPIHLLAINVDAKERNIDSFLEEIM